MLWSHVEDGVPSAPAPLPENWRQVSNLQALSESELNGLGWYQAQVEARPAYDRTSQLLNGVTVLDGTVVRMSWEVIDLPAEAVARLLEDHRKNAINAINQTAGSVRAKYMTVIPGQEATYLMKEAEVKAYLADPTPVATDYPMLKAEADACGMTLAEVATLVSTTAAAWKPLAAQIEGLRRGAIVAIEAATTAAEIDTAADVTWP